MTINDRASGGKKKRLLVTTRLTPAANEHLQSFSNEVDIVQADHDGSSTLIAKLLAQEQVDGVVCVIWDKFSSALLELHPRLKVISTISVGHEHIDLEATRRLGIRVGYTPDVLSEAVAELTVAMTIMALRRLREVRFS